MSSMWQKWLWIMVKKNDFEYQLCNNCQSVHISPRPLTKYFQSYYQDSPSTKYWATTFYKETESAEEINFGFQSKIG